MNKIDLVKTKESKTCRKKACICSRFRNRSIEKSDLYVTDKILLRASENSMLQNTVLKKVSSLKIYDKCHYNKLKILDDQHNSTVTRGGLEQ